ncbi:MAG: hypothetical protein MN733_19510, partial [Nitrososphaera sp.]|nr:hypothetical protein [Nitrososphaera sp.]
MEKWMRQSISVITVLGLVLVSVFVVWLLYQFIPPSGYRDTFLGNLLATLIGVVAAIPIGLEINRYTTEIQDQKSREADEGRRIDRLKWLLTLVKEELKLNASILTNLIRAQEDNDKAHNAYGLKDDFWDSITASGDIRWIDDLDLLDQIGFAYYMLRRIRMLEEKYFDPGFNMAVSQMRPNQPDVQSYAGVAVVRIVRELCPRALEKVNQAVTLIDEHLAELS